MNNLTINSIHELQVIDSNLSSTFQNKNKMTTFKARFFNLIRGKSISQEELIKTATIIAEAGIIPGIHCNLLTYGGRNLPYINKEGYMAILGDVDGLEFGEPDIIYRGDNYKVVRGVKPSLIHEPKLEGTHKDEDILAFYIIFRSKGGERQFIFMTNDDMLKRKANITRNKNNNYSPWNTHYSAMGKKTMLLLLGKRFINTKIANFYSDVEYHDEGHIYETKQDSKQAGGSLNVSNDGRVNQPTQEPNLEAEKPKTKKTFQSLT